MKIEDDVEDYEVEYVENGNRERRRVRLFLWRPKQLAQLKSKNRKKEH